MDAQRLHFLLIVADRPAESSGNIRYCRSGTNYRAGSFHEHAMFAVDPDNGLDHPAQAILCRYGPPLLLHPARIPLQAAGEKMEAAPACLEIIIFYQLVVVHIVQGLEQRGDAADQERQTVEQSLDKGLGNSLGLVGGEKDDIKGREEPFRLLLVAGDDETVRHPGIADLLLQQGLVAATADNHEPEPLRHPGRGPDDEGVSLVVPEKGHIAHQDVCFADAVPAPDLPAVCL